jgi:hypothetical protein
MQITLIGIITAAFHVPHQLLITHSAFVIYLRKMGQEWGGSSATHIPFFKKASDSGTSKVLYNAFTEFGIVMKWDGQKKLSLIKPTVKVRTREHLSDIFPIQNGLKKGDDPSPLLFIFALEYAIARFEQTRRRTKEFGDCVNLLAESIQCVY